MNNGQSVYLNNLLLVAGTGRNSGKTSLICNICDAWDDAVPLVCIKISNHIHPLPGTICLYAGPSFSIYEETSASSDKDTARMLRAGASKVLFIEAEGEFIYQALQKTLARYPEDIAIICESGTLRRFVTPSLFVMLHTKGSEPKQSSKDLMTVADKIFYTENENLQIPDRPAVFANGRWKLNCV
jgi:hypothetical protein